MPDIDANAYVSKTAQVLVGIGRENYVSTITFANNRIQAESNGRMVLYLTYEQVKKIRILNDGFLIYPKTQRLPIKIGYDFGHEGDQLLKLSNAEYEKMGTQIIGWEEFLRHTPIKLRAFSWPIFISLSILYLLIATIFIKFYSLIPYTIFCVLLAVLHQHKWRKL